MAYTFAFSFNDHGKTNIVWQGFTLKHWKDPCGAPGVCESLVTSLQVGAIATLVATVLGTLMAFALVRYRFRGKAASNMLIFVPMATPEVVMGASLLTIFVQGFSNIGLSLGFATIVIAHIMFCLSFVVVTVKARIADPRPAPRGGGARTCTPARCRPSGGSPSRWCCPASRRRAARVLAVLRRLHHHQLRLRHESTRSPSSSTSPPGAASPPQANVIGFSMFVIAVLLVVGAPGRQLACGARAKD